MNLLTGASLLLLHHPLAALDDLAAAQHRQERHRAAWPGYEMEPGLGSLDGRVGIRKLPRVMQDLAVL